VLGRSVFFLLRPFENQQYRPSTDKRPAIQGTGHKNPTVNVVPGGNGTYNRKNEDCQPRHDQTLGASPNTHRWDCRMIDFTVAHTSNAAGGD
jgi:hypothetical protein